MKATLFALPALVPLALGYSAVKARDLSQEEIQNAVPMTFTGPLTVGGPNVTLSGTVESIWARILQANPDYDAWEFPEYRTRMEEEGITRASQEAFETRVHLDGSVSERRSLLPKRDALFKRDWITCDPVGDQVGNWFNQCTEGIGYLRRLNGYCGAPAGWGGCSRVSCSWNCGIFLCNDNPFPISVWCGNLAGDAIDVGLECEDSWGRMKGQVFRDQYPGWNTVVRSQSC